MAMWRKSSMDKVDIDLDLKAITHFLKDIKPLHDRVNKMIEKMHLLRDKEAELRKLNAPIEDLQKILLLQVKLYDHLLQAYELYELDVVVNGERVKKIANELREKAIKYHIDDEWIKKIKKSDHWNFDW